MCLWYGNIVNNVHDLNVEFRPSNGVYTLFPSLSHNLIVVSDNRFVCCCYGLMTSLFATGRKVIFSSKTGYQWSSKYVCLFV